jgi:hypothetical protein
MRRRIPQWWRAAVAAVAILSPHAAAADPPVDDVPIAATPYAFDPATVAVATGVSSIDASASAAHDDMSLRLAEPDFTLIALPTALRVPRLRPPSARSLAADRRAPTGTSASTSPGNSSNA